ncbi:hypothetical protein [Bartonella sp. B17]
MVVEFLGLEDAEYYDNAGVLRDMMENCMVRLFYLVTTEMPFTDSACCKQ